MGSTDDWLADRAAEVRQRRAPGDEDALWLVFFDDPHGQPVLATAIDGAMAHIDSALINGLVQVLRGVPAKAVLLAVSRVAGQLEPVDRCLWDELVVSLSGVVELIDLIFVGTTGYASARTPGSESHAHARRPMGSDHGLVVGGP